MTHPTAPDEAAVLSDILNELRLQNSQQSELWDTGDIARFFKLSKSHTYSRVICRKNFPRPIIIPTTEIGGAKRWYAKEVRDWVKKYRKIA